MRGEIIFNHVAFGYDPELPVLRDISFTISRVEMFGIVGATGSGKSTIASLIPRFRDPDAGGITIDGVDVRDYALRKLRAQIGFVLQDTVLLRGTVRDNIGFGRPDATEDEIVEAAKLANAHEFITPHAQWLRQRRRRPWYDAVGRAAPTHRDRPRAHPRQPNSDS